MSSESRTTMCPHCHSNVIAATYCEQCGEPLCVDESPLSSDRPAQVELPSEDPPMDGDPGRQKTPSPVSPPAPPASSERRPEEQPIPVSSPVVQEMPSDTSPQKASLKKRPSTKEEPDSPPPPQEKTYCDHLRVRHNLNAVFQQGLVAPFQYEITPTHEGISALKVTVEIDSGNGRVAKLEKVAKRILTLGVPGIVSLPFSPSDWNIGKPSINVFFSYRLGQKKNRFVADVEHNVFPAWVKPQRVLEKLIIDAHNETQSDVAAEVNIHQRIENLQEALRPIQEDPRASLDIIDVPKEWRPLRLFPCEEAVASPRVRGKDALQEVSAPREARLNRLTLSVDNERIHLIGGQTITLGKNRRNAIVTRRFDGNGEAVMEMNERISRFPCRLRHVEGRVELLSSGIDPNTGEECLPGWGVYLNGQRVPSNATHPLPFNEDLRLSVAEQTWEGDKGFHALLRVWTGDVLPSFETQCAYHSNSEPAFALLIRRDGLPEKFICLWTYCPLECIDSRLRDLCVCRSGDCFVLRGVDSCEWLTPGRHFSHRGTDIHVTDFDQVYVETWQEEAENSL